jgi:maltose/maltodextrin transport system permease protein
MSSSTTLPSSPLASGATLRPHPAGGQTPWLRWALLAVLTLALLWLVFRIIVAGQPVWAVGALALGGSALYVYGSARTLAGRYLFPGVAGMLLFVAFPLLYTMQMGFTNHSATHLLTEARARDYLLAQGRFDEARTLGYTLHAEGGGRFRLRLAPLDGGTGPTFVTPPIDLTPGAAAPVALQLAPAEPLGAALSLRELLQHRDALMALQLQAADGVLLSYAGVRTYGPLQPQWQANADGSLTERATGTVYTPNRSSGFFESASGDRLQPGFQVNIGLANYARMLLDADFRGPFFSIFVWTVVFAGLTVLFSSLLGMTLAVLLNWEALRFRTLYRTLLFLPYAVPGFISILVFKGLFNQNFGEINAILDALFGIRPAWFADPWLAKAMLLIVNVWMGYPYFLVLCTGLIKAIPADLYEASAIVGATPMVNFMKITAPLIIKPLTPLLISAFAFNFNNFVLIALLTDGRPDYLNTKLPAGTTDILVSYTYRIAFTDAGANFGLAAAISTLIFFMVALMSLANLKLARLNDSSGR